MIPRIGLTLGDPAGIGPEIVLKALRKVEIEYDPLLIGSIQLAEIARDIVGEGLRIIPRERFDHVPGALRIHDCGDPDLSSINPGRESKEAARVSYLWVVEAVKLALKRSVDAVVTAPINKASWKSAGYNYPGHTQLLASLTDAENYGMMMVAESLRVLLITTHIPIGQVPREIDKGEIERKILLAHSSLKNLFRMADPKIAVCALNPHRGEQGVLGREESEEIEPAVQSCRDKGIAVEGPFPSDTLFLKRRQYDCIVAMYHDQGLIPFKLLSFGKGVNLTLGLPFIRTSPDHGTAYEIAGKGMADPSSMVEAIHLACELVKNMNQV